MKSIKLSKYLDLHNFLFKKKVTILLQQTLIIYSLNLFYFNIYKCLLL